MTNNSLTAHKVSATFKFFWGILPPLFQAGAEIPRGHALRAAGGQGREAQLHRAGARRGDRPEEDEDAAEPQPQARGVRRGGLQGRRPGGRAQHRQGHGHRHRPHHKGRKGGTQRTQWGHFTVWSLRTLR